MSDRRPLLDAEPRGRRRSSTRTTPLGAPGRPPATTRPAVVLLAVALVLVAGAAAGAALAGRTPQGWSAAGTLVLDAGTGARYLADGDALRPAPTLTGALLAGARPGPVLVPHEVVARARTGAPLPGEGLPDVPPQLPATPTGFTACVDQEGAVGVHAGAPSLTPAPEQGLLVRPGEDGALHLVTGSAAHPVTDAAATALGYSLEQQRRVPPAWLALVPTGARLDLLAVPAPDPTRGVAGVGAGGEVVVAAGGVGAGRRFLIDGGALRPVVGRTSELLAPPPVREVAAPVLDAAPAGPPLAVPGAPEDPPRVPPSQAPVVACVRSSDGLVTVTGRVSDAANRPAPTLALDVGPEPLAVTWHFPPGGGALVAPVTVDTPAEPDAPAEGPAAAAVPPGAGTGGIRVVAGGRAHEVADLGALRALGYRRDQAVLLPDAWLRLLALGDPLATQR